MRFKDLSKFDNDEYDSENEEYKSTSGLEEMAKNVQMNGITLLDLSSSPIQPFSGYIIDILLIALPNLREVDFSNRCVTTYPILGQCLDNCPPLEIVTSNNSGFVTL
jgi:hypothetical protein